jgi:hypothetical protein
MTNTFHVVCPVCGTQLVFDTGVTEFWGFIPVLDIGCVEVTRPSTPEIEEHLAEHRADGTLVAAARRQYEYDAEHSPKIAARYREVLGID